MRGSVPVVPAPDSPKTLEPRRPLGSPADVEEGELGPSSGKSKASSAKSLTSKNSVNAVRLGGLQHSSEESGDESCQRLLRKLSAMKATWVLVTLVVIILCGALAGPVVCKESAKCTEDHLKDQDLRFYSALIAAALASVLMQELASVILTNQAASRAVELIPDVKDSLIPSMLLCTTFIVLLVENLAFVIGEVPWYVHAANLGREDLDGQPVYSVFYAEWVINVPILLILAGSISLGRPPSEVGQPLLITNVYIVLAWVANFIPNVPLRCTVVAVAFLMYFRASWMMCNWVRNWRKRHSDGHILGRPLLSFVLIVVFGIYGLVYLGRLHGLVPYRDARIFFVTMNFTTKLFASMTLAGIRSSEFQEVLLTMLANTQTSFKRSVNYEDQITLLAD